MKSTPSNVYTCIKNRYKNSENCYREPQHVKIYQNFHNQFFTMITMLSLFFFAIFDLISLLNLINFAERHPDFAWRTHFGNLNNVWGNTCGYIKNLKTKGNICLQKSKNLLFWAYLSEHFVALECKTKIKWDDTVLSFIWNLSCHTMHSRVFLLEIVNMKMQYYLSRNETFITFFSKQLELHHSKEIYIFN